MVCFVRCEVELLGAYADVLQDLAAVTLPVVMVDSSMVDSSMEPED